MPRHPAVGLSVVLAVVFLVPVVLGLVLTDGSSLLFWFFLGVALMFVYFAIHAKRTALPVQHNNSAVNALYAGRHEDVEAHLVEAERSSARLLRITTNFIRAQLHLQ